MVLVLVREGATVPQFTPEEQEALAELKKAGLLDDSMGFLLDEKVPFGGLVDPPKAEEKKGEEEEDVEEEVEMEEEVEE